MRLRLFQLMLFVISGSLLIFTSSCGAPANQNTATNKGTSNNANAPANNANASNASTAGTIASTCTESDDKQIEQAIRISIDEDADLRRQKKHINYDSKYCNVKLHGWIDTWANFKKLHGRVNGIEGVKKMDLTSFDVKPSVAAEEACRPPFKQCGEICIPDTDDCNILIDPTLPDPTPSRTP